VFFAYCFPYTYTDLKLFLARVEGEPGRWVVQS
jgi:hypothetical protein